MNLINEIFDGIEYTLVEVYQEDEPIYHFVADDDEIFAVKNDAGKYIKITDEEKINTIKTTYNLHNIEFLLYSDKMISILENVKGLEAVPDKDRTNFINNIVLNKLSKVCPNINVEDIMHKFSKIGMYQVDSFGRNIKGVYSKVTNAIFTLKNNNSLDERVKFHETMHALFGPKFSNIFDLGINEGLADNFTELAFGDETSSTDGTIKFNFSFLGTNYSAQVALVRQMIYSLGRDFGDYNILKDPLAFLDEFSNKYGKDTCRFVKHRARRMLNPSRNMGDFDKYFAITQDIMMVNIFNKDFENVTDIDSAKKYLEKLQGFELVRAEVRDNDFFEKYYTTKRKELLDRFIDAGIPQGYATEVLKPYKHSEFKISITPENLQKLSASRVARRIADFKYREVKEEERRTGHKVTIDEVKSEYKCYMCDLDPESKFAIILKNGEIISRGKISRTFFSNGPTSDFVVEENAEKVFSVHLPDGTKHNMTEFEIPEEILVAEQKKVEHSNQNVTSDLQSKKLLDEAKKFSKRIIKRDKGPSKEFEDER